jgi:hypothetical protein
VTTITSAALAALLGVALAGAAAFGVVQSQQSAGSSPVDQSSVSYDG